MHRLLASLAFVALAALTALPGAADPATDAVRNAFVAFSHATSYHVNVQAQGKTVNGDVVPPDKYHFIVPPTELIVIGSYTYVKLNGAWRQFNAAGFAGFTAPLDRVKAMTASPDSVKVTDLGMKTVDGQSLHAYSVLSAGNNGASTVYIDGGGLPVRVDSSSGEIVRFSQFNSPAITIVAPV